ncbi:DUF3494 domain-containing protein [Plantibacter flavus]|uniref:ice-binding family protein n=1 Tax=Plantibacter flavus TaxID=150123 RepID=UPI003F17CC43
MRLHTLVPPTANSRRSSRSRPRLGSVLITAVAAATCVLLGVSPASAATTIDGPIDLGSAADFGVLGASTVTNTGPSVITGDVGLSPGSEVTGFPPGLSGGTLHVTDEVAALAQDDLGTAMGVASSLTPTTQGLGDLAGLSLTPGVYSGGELSLNGELTLSGTAESVWVFQAASTLVTGTGASIILTDGASACNVFWRVGSSATLGESTDFAGTILADESITTVTGTTVEGRLLASTGAVTLDSTVVTQPVGCDDGSGSVVTSSPTITSPPLTNGTVGTPYSGTVTSTGSPVVGYTVTSGALPPGLVLDGTTGAVTGTPTTPGTFTVTITASNGTAPDDSVTSTITVLAAVAPVSALPAGSGSDATSLPATGVDGLALGLLGAALLLLGFALVASARIVSRRDMPGATG